MPFGYLSDTILGDLRVACILWDMMSSGTDLPLVDQARATRALLLGTFMGLGLDLKLDKLYDLGGAIPDVMGLRAIQPKAAIAKVMSVLGSRCVQGLSWLTMILQIDFTRFSYMIWKMRNPRLWLSVNLVVFD